MNRKDFISAVAGLTLVPAITEVLAMKKEHQNVNRLSDEDFWTDIRRQFALDESVIDLRANSASSIPQVSINKFTADYRFAQIFPSSRNSEMNEAAMKILRAKIAKQINCSEKEIAVMRSTTEALNNAIMGISLGKDDEIVASRHEYDSMMGSFYQRKIRDGIVIKTLDIPYRISSTDEILNLWEKSITPKTKVFLISQIVWISGQIYPVKEICELARKHNIITIVDAAHSFSHIDIDIKYLGCDYLGTSLHKWCAAPLGTGFLYIRRELIPKTYPLFAHYIYKPDDEAIEKFDNFGTATPVFSAAIESLVYWEKLGLKLKTQRMQFLKQYWTEKLKQIPKIEIVTNTDGKHSCGLAFFKVRGRRSTEIRDILWKKHQILLPVIENYKNFYVDYGDVSVLGVATPVYVTPKQLDVFIKTLENIVR